MTSTIQRFVTALPEQVNSLIGQQTAADEISEASDRDVTARSLYEKSLRGVVRFVRFFQMRNTKDQPIYDLFFASNHSKGHYKMKEAMWKVNERGDYSFSDGVDPAQGVLFSANPGSLLAPVLWERFRARTVDAEDILEYTRDDTAFLEKHARAALKILESEGDFERHRIHVGEKKQNGTKRRRGSYPQGTIITFLDE